jgi:hypothetical protein
MKWGSHPPGPGTKNPRTGNQDPILSAPDHATGSARSPRDPRIGKQETNQRGGTWWMGGYMELVQTGALVHPGGRRHQRPRPSAAVGGGGDDADRGRRGGGLEERARELRGRLRRRPPPCRRSRTRTRCCPAPWPASDRAMEIAGAGGGDGGRRHLIAL